MLNMTGTREKRNHAFHKLFFAALLAGPAVLAPISADAQLRPWDAGNEVLVDMSVLENGGLDPAPRTSGGIVLPSLRGNLLDPPRRAPRSRLLYNSPPRADQAKGTDLPQVKLIPPSAWSKKKPSTRRAPSKPRPKLKSAPKMPAAQKPATRLTPKPPVAPAPPAQPKPEVKISKAPPPPPAVPKAAPVPEKPAAPVTQTASREPPPASQSVAFASGTSSLSSASQKQLDGVAAQLNAQPDARMQLLAYAGEPNMSSSKARRLSLSRALAVRSYLINKGVKSTRIDVRALGNQGPQGSPSRVDMRVIGN
jgi:outer membrane protein OmpA-like peptidoglycan-associated protein